MLKEIPLFEIQFLGSKARLNVDNNHRPPGTGPGTYHDRKSMALAIAGQKASGSVDPF